MIIHPNFTSNDLLPCIVQHALTQQVLMLGYMNEEAFRLTLDTNKVTFYSRSRSALWVKGETSGNFLHLESWSIDCDQDAILVGVLPQGPTCHTGSYSCFGEQSSQGFLTALQAIIVDRSKEEPSSSYTADLMTKGIAKISQKVGEEAVETVIEAMKPDLANTEEEAADLLYHLLVLLHAKGSSISKVEALLSKRHHTKL